MNHIKWTHSVLVSTAIMVLGASATGCATTTGPEQGALEQQIANARTRADHERLAQWYEQAAADATQRAEAHRRALERYRQSPYTAYYSAHHITAAAFAQRCQSAIRSHEQIAADDLALAKLHRDLAAEVQK